jgi:hypothetical protein
MTMKIKLEDIKHLKIIEEQSKLDLKIQIQEIAEIGFLASRRIGDYGIILEGTDNGERRLHYIGGRFEKRGYNYLIISQRSSGNYRLDNNLVSSWEAHPIDNLSFYKKIGDYIKEESEK